MRTQLILPLLPQTGDRLVSEEGGRTCRYEGYTIPASIVWLPSATVPSLGRVLRNQLLETNPISFSYQVSYSKPDQSIYICLSDTSTWDDQKGKTQTRPKQEPVGAAQRLK